MRKIAIVTGTRAEYGILFPLIRAVDADPDLNLQLIVTGMHLVAEFGMTANQIEKDGFTISKKIDMKLNSDSKSGTAKSVGIGLSLFADAYEELKPDIIVVLGDRSELMAATVPAVLMNIPIAHISGGDVTEGAFDDSIRHALTKFSSLHFTTTETYRNRVIQMGERPETVFNVGSMSIDQILAMKPTSIAEVSASLKFDVTLGYILVTYHPETRADSTVEDFKEVLAALEQLTQKMKIVFTYPNSDPAGRQFIEMINAFVANHPDTSRAYASLGNDLYLATAKNAKVVVGNSSSGITEIPSLKVPTINIGNRQKGRLASASVLNCEPKKSAIVVAVEKALSSQFKAIVERGENPYGDGKSTPRILEKLKSVQLDGLANKKFYDIPTQKL